METVKKYHMRRRKQQVVDSVILYLVTPLVCALFCSSPIWFPTLCSSLKALFFVTLPHIASVFITSKSLFILGNLIVVLLVRESKIFASSHSSSPAEATATNTVYDEYVTRRHSLQHSQSDVVVLSNDEDGEEMQEEEWVMECVEEEEEEEEAAEHVEPAQDLNKRADDFIARVNKQRRLEAHC